MNYILLVTVAIAGIALGMYISRRGKSEFISKQMKTKVENKQKILAYVQEHGKIQNNDVEKLVGVSNATAERYLNELEMEGKITQNGTIGKAVFYSLK